MRYGDNKRRVAVSLGPLIQTVVYEECWVRQKKVKIRINAVEMRALRSSCDLSLGGRKRNNVIR